MNTTDHELRPLPLPHERTVNEHGSKVRMNPSPISAYSDWRRTVGDGCYANDIDWVEWRTESGMRRFVAVIDTTIYEDKPELRHCLPQYCEAALVRFKRDAQCEIVTAVAAALKVPAYFVIAREDMAVFFVCRLRDEAWREMDQSAYVRWLKRLGRVG